MYHDRHSIFERNTLPSLEKELNGQQPKTQFGRLLEELGIESIAAHSPQAKGRIERLWGTFQNRLVSELIPNCNQDDTYQLWGGLRYGLAHQHSTLE